jgi:large subunit ribosomal protein L3
MSEENNTTANEEVEAAAAEETSENATTEEASSNEVGLSSVYGFKKGMSAIYNDEGVRIPVTVLECKPWTVTQVKTKNKDGYDSVQISFGNKKAKNASKSENGHFKASGSQTGFQFSREVRGEAPEGCTAGQMASLAALEVGKKVQITANSKGRGFSGVMKRHGFGGGPASHGSGFHRRPGSIGNCTFPGRVMPGRKMPGQYGNKTATVKGVEVVGVNLEENVVLLKGAVPGPVNGLVKIATKG